MKNWPEEVVLGYVAGFMDGEGCIEIGKAECGLRIRIANTFKEALDEMHSRLGIGRVIEYARPANMGYKRLFCFEVSNTRDVRELLLLVRPYLIVKAERADQALEIVRRQQARMDDLDARNRAILAAVQAGEQQKLIAKRFAVSPQLVSRIKKGHTWPTEIAKLQARQSIKKWLKPSDAVFRLHGLPPPE